MSTSSQIYILAEQNGEQIKVPYSEFEAQFVKYNQTTPSSPNSQPVDSTQGMVTADGWDPGFLDDGGSQSSFYVYSNNLWRKIPTYTKHWSDLEGDKVRFLPLHKKLEGDDALSEEEVENLKYNLSCLPIATTEYPGLVKAGEASTTRSYVQVISTEDEASEENGRMFVQFATRTNPGTVLVEDLYPAVPPIELYENGEPIEGEEEGEGEGEEEETVMEFPTVVYSKAAVDALFSSTASGVPIATPSSPGIVTVGDHLSIGEDSKLTVVKASVQEEEDYGVVKYANSDYVNNITTDVNYVYKGDIQEEYETTLSIHQIKALIDSKIKNNGSSILDVPFASTDQAGVISVDGRIFTIDQATARIDINLANKETKGAVFVIDTLDELAVQSSFANHVPTALSVINFVNEKVSEVERQPVTIPMASEEILGAIKVGPGLSISTSGVLQVNYPVTSATTLGLVKTLHTSTLASGINNDPKLVPTVFTMQKYVDSKLTSAGSGSIQPASSTVLGGVYVYKASTDPDSNPTVYTKGAVDILFAGYATKQYVDTQIEIVQNGTAVIPKATLNNAGTVRVKSLTGGETNNDTNGGYIVPTINYMEDRIATIKGSGGSGTISKDVGDVCSAYSNYKNWLLIGSDTLDDTRLGFAAELCKEDYSQYEGIDDFTLINKNTNEAFPEGNNVLIFSTAIPYTYVQILIQYYYTRTEDFDGDPFNEQNIDFVILPASATYQQQLTLS